MKTAILGGSFNPVHMGHLYLADTVLSYGYDRIILIPAFQSPFKINAEAASPRDRLDMLCASITGDPGITVDECEIRREGVSYTIDTIADIKRRYLPDGKPGLILGDDLLDTFHLWRDAPSIARESDIIVARRLDDSENPGANSEFPYPHVKLNNNLMEISSRLVREKILAGENWRYLVPSGAASIIEDRKLYGFHSSESKTEIISFKNVHESTVFFESLARRTLNTSRFLHSRHTALLARDLCQKYGYEPAKGYLAGIVHDLCKSMDHSELLDLAESDGLLISGLEYKKPSLLHGRAAATILQTRYNIMDEDILEAVRYHVTGGSDTGPLAKILYIADKIEVSRYWLDPGIREISRNTGLDELFTAVLHYTQEYIIENS